MWVRIPPLQISGGSMESTEDILDVTFYHPTEESEKIYNMLGLGNIFADAYYYYNSLLFPDFENLTEYNGFLTGV